MERTPCTNLRNIQPGEWVLVGSKRTGKIAPRQVVSVDAEAGVFHTVLHGYRIVNPSLAENFKDGDMVALAVPAGMPVETWMPYARH